MTVTVKKLLERRAVISIDLGRLTIRPPHDRPLPPGWLEKYSAALVREILVALNIEAYRYESYSTGHYGPTKAGGLTLQLPSVLADTDTYTIFNVRLARDKSTKSGSKGSPLPRGHFRLIGMRSNFHRFWQSTALPLPRRLSSFHDYMGHLKGILFSAEIADNHSNRLNSGSLRPLSISAAKILETFEPDIYHTTHGQTTDNSRTILPDKKITPALQNRGIQEEFITCAAKHGKAVISRNGNPHLHGFRRKTPQEQTNEEWEAEFSQPA